MKTFVGMVAVVLAVLALAGGCGVLVGNAASESSARQALVVQGFSHIRYVSRQVWFVALSGCSSHDDVARFTFRATNPIGRRVTVYVCAGWPFKGDTVRYP